MKKLLAMLLILATLVSVSVSAFAAKDDVVNITIYTRVVEQDNQKAVFEALNKYTAEKIGVTANWVFLGGNYADKIQVITASGEEFDASYTSSWMNPYSTGVAKGAFVDLTDMLANECIALYNELPAYLWNATRVGGRIFAVPNQQIVARQFVQALNKKYYDAAVEAGVVFPEKFSYDFTELEEYGKFCYENFGAKICPPLMTDASVFSGYEFVTDYLSCGAISMKGDIPVVVNLYETEEYKNLVSQMAMLADEGILDSQCAYDSEYQVNEISAGKVCNTYQVNKPGLAAEMYGRYGNQNFEVFASTEDPYITTNSVIATMYGVSSTSKHPLETLKYLELIDTDPVAMNMLCYGIEGVTYEKTNDTQVKYIQGGGYSPASNWAFGNTFIAYTLDGQPKDAIEITKNLNDTGRSSAILGFSFNSEPVKSELASVAKVVEEYCQVIAGEMPVDETITALNEKLKIAGVDNIVAEMQRQIDEFLLTK